MSNTRIAHQGTIFSLLLLLVALAVAGMAASGVRSISVIDRALHDFNQKTVAKQAALERLQGALGGGGLVQGYKDYILQPDEDRLTEVTAAAAAVSENISGITQATGETGAASARVLESAEKLSRQADNLRGGVERFLEGIRGD